MTMTQIRRAGVLALVVATTTTLTACAGVVGAKMTYHDTEKAKITDIVVAGGAGDVTVETAEVTETTITRVIRRSSDPGESYRLDGSTLTVDASCGVRCSVSYLIKTPPGVTVRGKLGSGDVRLAGIATTDLQVGSGDLTVLNAAGPVKVQTNSGDIKVLDAKDTVQTETGSGDTDVINAAKAVTAKVHSGNLTVLLTEPGSVTAESGSGDIKVTVPEGSYRLVTDTGSGDVDLHGMDSDRNATNVIDVKAGSGDVNVASLP
jgi:DUF4097 and DUF4098 domain-containing protein YvlB